MSPGRRRTGPPIPGRRGSSPWRSLRIRRPADCREDVLWAGSARQRARSGSDRSWMRCQVVGSAHAHGSGAGAGAGAKRATSSACRKQINQYL